MSENYTDIDVGPGSVISELLVKLAAAVQNEQYNTISSLAQGKSITEALDSSTDTYSPVIDLIASNYNTERSGGSKVTGRVKVYVSDSNGYTFNEGFTFIQPALNLTYYLTETLRVSPKPSTILNEQQLYSENGLYYFTLPVEAENPGPEYQVSSGTVFVLQESEFISDLVKIEAYGNFSSGKSVETDKEVIAKIKYNLGHSRYESPVGIYKKFSETFPGFQALSVCGANDPEMTRAKQNILGISTFGKADVYVRTSLAPAIKQLTDKKAKNIGGDVWEMEIENYEIPGFYSIVSIVPQFTQYNLGGTLVFDPPSFHKAFYSDQKYNEIFSDADARFTKYQRAVVRFKYTPYEGALNPDQLFTVHATYQPNILEMQNMLLLDDERLACADYLVKAVLPCMVSLNITLTKKRTIDSFESLNLQQLKKDIFTYINTIPFEGELDASKIVDICHNYDIKRVELPISMRGNILCLDGTALTLEANDVLTIPYNLEKGVTPRTTMYFIDYYRIVNGEVNPIDNIGIKLV
jgi:hypothetical protein